MGGSDIATKLRYKSFVTPLESADKKTGWVGKKFVDDPFADNLDKVGMDGVT